MDRGANGCIIGSDMSIADRTNKYINLTGIEDHTVRELNIVNAACVAVSHLGPIILEEIGQGAHMPDTKLIISPLQLEAYGCTIMDKARALNGGEQPYIQTPDGYRIPLTMYQGLMYIDVRPVRDDEWATLPHSRITATNKWDPRIYNHDIKEDWDKDQPDPVEEHYREQPYNRIGRMKYEDNEEDDGEQTTRAEIEANLTASIEDELIGSVIEYEIDGNIFHRDLSDEDKDCEWGDWIEANKSRWYGYDVEGRRRSKRERQHINCDDTKRRNRTSAQKEQSDCCKDNSTTVTSPTVKTTVSDSEEEDATRTGYNNPAKSTAQNEKRTVEGGPMIGKPSQIDFEKYRKNFAGAPPDVVERTFESTTQMGRLGVVKGLKLAMETSQST